MDALTELTIKQACADLVARYCRAVNAWNLDDFMALFAEDGVWRRLEEAPMVGRAAIRAFMENQPKNRVLRHVNGAVHVEPISEDSAEVWSQTTVYDAPGATQTPAYLDGPDMVVEYRDRHERREGRWFIVRRHTTQVFSRRAARPFGAP